MLNELRARLQSLSTRGVPFEEVATLESLVNGLEARLEPAHALDALFEALFESAVDGIVIIDARGRIQWSNGAMAGMFGYGRAELLGNNVSMLMGAADREHHDAYIARYLSSGQARVIGRGRRVEGLHREGRAIPVDLAVVEVPVDTGRLFGGIMRDMTEQVAAESELREAERRLMQSQKLEAVGTLASGIAHDFNNLLMAVSGSATVALRMLPAGGDARRFVEEIRAEATRGRGLTRQLLAFSRERWGGEGVADLNTVVSDAMQLLASFVGEDVLVDLTLTDRPVCVPGEPGQWEQVVFNLVINARHAMPLGGGLRIWTTVEEVGQGGRGAVGELAPGRYGALHVEDEGCGMEPEVKARVFEPFFTTRPVDQGTGLGLSMVYGLVKQWGGHIELESSVGVGTCFGIYLPLVEDGPQESVTQAVSTTQGGQGEHILLVEDEERVRRVLCRYLRDAGYAVRECARAEEALVACDRGVEVDLLLTDLVLPGMLGHELADRVLARRPGLPVLFMSAHAQRWLVERGQLSASAPLLEKPFSEEELRVAIAAALSGGGEAPEGSAVERAAAAASSAVGRGRSEGASERVQGGRVLLVEDHELARRATRALLEEEGFEVLEASDIATAEHVWGAVGGEVAAVISDIGLPDGDGVEWVEALRVRAPSLGVIFVSGRSQDDRGVARGLRISGAAFLQKPIHIEELFRVLSRLLER